jgi:hypothetical protein
MPGLDLSSVATFLEGFILLDTVRFSRPAAGAPVFNETTGEYVWPTAETVYEGPGAVQVAGTPGGLPSIPGQSQPWVGETNSKYVALTPLAAPVAEKDMLVTVLQVHAGGDPALLGRQWRVQDPGNAGTISVLRVTGLDQVQQTREAAS